MSSSLYVSTGSLPCNKVFEALLIGAYEKYKGDRNPKMLEEVFHTACPGGRCFKVGDAYLGGIDLTPCMKERKIDVGPYDAIHGSGAAKSALKAHQAYIDEKSKASLEDAFARSIGASHPD